MADSLDMLADALVYGLSLFAVGATVVRKKNVARLSGYFQMTLAVLGILEVLQRIIGAKTLPDFRIMIGASVFALIANGLCLYLLGCSKDQGAHIQASMIFASNDVIINLGVINAGVLVLWLETGIPDLVIGAIVFMVMTLGAVRILVVVDPRRTSSLTVMETIDLAGTLHLRPNLGTDFVLANAVARAI